MIYEFMRRLQSFLPLLLIVLSYPNLSSAEEQTIYTIQCLSTAEIKYAEEVFHKISKLVSVSVRLERVFQYYAVRVGIAQNMSELRPVLDELKKYPFVSNAFIRTAYYKKVNIILENVGQGLQAIIPQTPDRGIRGQAGTEEELEEKPKDMKRFLKPAWQYFNQGNYKQAIEIFTTLSSFPETELEAKYGLAMCYVKLKEPKKVLSLLELLIKRRFDLKNTLPAMLALLVEEKEYTKAESYLAMISEKERKEWEGRIKIRMTDAEFEEAKKAGNGNRLIEFSEKNSASIDNCFMPDIFYEAANLLSENNREYAANIYKKLLEVCPDKQGLRLRILYSLKSIVTTAEALLLLENEVKAASDSDYKNKLTDIKISVLIEGFTALKPDSAEIEDTANSILALKPSDNGVRSTLAWWFLNNRHYEKAYEEFYTLYQRNPQERDYIYGLINTLIKLKRTDEAIELAAKNKDKDARFASLEIDIRLSVLIDKLAALAPDSPELEDTVREILVLKPEDEGVRETLAWWYFRKELYNKAYEEFHSLYQRSPETKDYIYGLVNTLVKLGKTDEALELTGRYKNNEKIAALEKDIRLSVLGSKLASLSPDSPELEDITREILVLKPEEEGTREMLAWWYYRKEDYEKAYDEFYTLYNRSPDTKGYAFGLVNSLVKLDRLDEALELAAKNKGYDERLSSIEIDIYISKANVAYRDKKYHEAEIYFEKVLAENPEDTKTKKLLEWSKYNQTFFGRAMSSIEGLPGFTWGRITHDLNGDTGIGGAGLVNQGIDWVNLPGDIILNTFAEYRYRSRTRERRYFDESGQTLGFEFKKPPFRLGAEYSWEEYTEQNKTAITKRAYLAWYQEWYKYMKRRGDDSWLKIQALSGYTYGRITHDLDNMTGTGISGAANQGIDWLTLPGDITLNTYAEYRFSFRTEDNFWYNSHGPALGIELQRPPFKFGMDYFWENYTKRNITNNLWRLYFTWYYNWDLKPKE